MTLRRLATFTAVMLTLVATVVPTAGAAKPLSKTVQVNEFAQGFWFDAPQTWTEQRFAVASSFSSLIGYLSPVTLRDPCTRTSNDSGALTSISCGWPLESLPAGGILVEWDIVGFPRPIGQPVVADPNTTIGGQPARVTVDRPGDCGALGADESIRADIARPGYEDELLMRACLRGPRLGTADTAVRRMLRSTTFFPLPQGGPT